MISFFFPFVTFNGCLLFLCSYLVSMFQIVFVIISVSVEFVSSVIVLPYSRGRHGKFALTVTGPGHVPILTRPRSLFLFTCLSKVDLPSIHVCRAFSFSDLLTVLPCSSRHAYSAQDFPWNEPMLARCFTARTPQFRLVFLIWRLSGMLFSEQDECFTRLSYLPRSGAGRLFHT